MKKKNAYDVLYEAMNSCIRIMKKRGTDLSPSEIENIRRVSIEASFLFKNACIDEMFGFIDTYRIFKDERSRLNV